jgi:hypothetical protein
VIQFRNDGSFPGFHQVDGGLNGRRIVDGFITHGPERLRGYGRQGVVGTEASRGFATHGQGGYQQEGQKIPNSSR